jgi:hypothetical protein
MNTSWSLWDSFILHELFDVVQMPYLLSKWSSNILVHWLRWFMPNSFRTTVSTELQGGLWISAIRCHLGCCVDNSRFNQSS